MDDDILILIKEVKKDLDEMEKCYIKILQTRQQGGEDVTEEG